MKRLVVGITGASGAIYGIRLLEVLHQKEDVETHLILSNWAKQTIEAETQYGCEKVLRFADYFHEENNLGACVSSGSFRHSGMVIVPCSMKSLGAIANGISGNLLYRAADVSLKEQRKLVLVVRETPLNPIHLENMLKLGRLGAVIMPPVPSYYAHPKSVEEIVNQFVGRILDQFEIEHDLCKRWIGMKKVNQA